MTGAGMAARVDCALRLTQRRDGPATHIDGNLVAARAPASGEDGSGHTRQSGGDEISKTRGGQSSHRPGDSLASTDGDGRPSSCLHTYAITTIAARSAPRYRVNGAVPIGLPA